MSDEWQRRLAATIGRQLAYYRACTPGEGKGGKMSAQALSDRCAKLGHPIDRAVIAKLERGFRQATPLADVLVLARALGIPPIQLIFPLGPGETVEVIPGEHDDAWRALRWFTGESAGQDTLVQSWRRRRGCMVCLGAPPSGFMCKSCGTG